MQISIGQKIKSFRQELKITIPQLAESTGLSRGFISQVENDKVSLSLDSLQKIAEALHMPVKNFLDDQPFEPVLTKNNSRSRIKSEGEHEIEILSAAFGRQLQVLIVDLPFGYQTGNQAHIQDGEEFILVLQGRVNVIQGKFSAILEEGDSIHLDGTYPHLCRNIENQLAKILVAATPPALLPIEKAEEEFLT